MSNPLKSKTELAEEACEIIELAIADIEKLSRAFGVIDEVCQEFNSPFIQLEDEPESRLN